MPKLIKNETRRLIESAVEFYNLALMQINTPKMVWRKIAEGENSAFFGLMGASAELLVKACLVEGIGIKAMYDNDDVKGGKFKFARDAIDE
jgi:hypothetical protein